MAKAIMGIGGTVADVPADEGLTNDEKWARGEGDYWAENCATCKEVTLHRRVFAACDGPPDCPEEGEDGPHTCGENCPLVVCTMCGNGYDLEPKRL